MENKSHALAAGIFVLVVTALLIGLASWLMRDTVSTTTYQMTTDEAVSGLQPQAAVRYKGVAVGKVTDIGFDPEKRGNVLVTLAVDKDAPITRSTYAELAYQGVTGLSFVQLDDDGGSAEPPERHDGGPPRIPLKPNLFGQLSDRAQELVGKLDETVDRVNHLLGDQNQAALSQAIQQVAVAAQETAGAAKSINALAADTNRTIEAQFGPRHSSIPQLVNQTTAALKTVQEAAAQTRQTVASLDGVAGDLKKGMGELTGKGGVVDRLGESVNTFGSTTLPRIQTLTDDASRTIRRLDRVANTIGENPQSLLYGHGAIPPGPGEHGFEPPP
ncbi:MlaD family protein [Ottowia sp.]|uniref:MlaD family protein n=1 Tax=Ottowia sp. TaxID=1898956 RepID=UPI002636B28F|nr:MlaD family protein [Ottowia sp.]